MYAQFPLNYTANSGVIYAPCLKHTPEEEMSNQGVTEVYKFNKLNVDRKTRSPEEGSLSLLSVYCKPLRWLGRSVNWNSTFQTP